PRPSMHRRPPSRLRPRLAMAPKAAPTTRSSRRPTTRSSTRRRRRPLKRDCRGLVSTCPRPTFMTDEVQNTEQQVEQQSDKLEALQKERDELLDTLQRVQAEFDNYRKRAARDQQSLVTRAHERLVKELLPVLDDLERALEAAEAHEEAELEEGVALVMRSFADVLRKEGLEEVPTDGKL